MDTKMTALEMWNSLEDEWEIANKAATAAQTALDYKLRMHLVNENSPAPTSADQEKVDNLWFREVELRGNMDEFMGERFDKPTQ